MEIFKKINYLLSKKSKHRIAFLFVLIIIGSFAELLGISILLPIINLCMPGADYQGDTFCRLVIKITHVSTKEQILLYLIGFTILIYILKSIFLSLMYSYLYRCAAEVKRELSTTLLNAYLKQPYVFFLNKNSSELIRSADLDVGQFYQVIINILRIATNGITIVIIIAYLAINNFAMTMTVALILAVCLLVIMFGVHKRTAYIGQVRQKQGALLIQYLKQAIEGIKEIKILNTEHYFMKKYDDTYYKQADVDRKFNVMNWIPKYAIEVVSICGILGYMGLNILTNSNYSDLVPQLAIFAAAAMKLLPEVNGVYSYVNMISFYKASVDLLYHDVKETEDFNEVIIKNSSDIKPMNFSREIQVRDAVFQYKENDRKILDKIDMIIEKGTSVALVGPSGGGKTTLADIILGLLSLNGGQVLVDNIDIRDHLFSWRRNIGYIPQTIYLTDDTIRNNVAFGVAKEEIDDKEVWRALDEAQLKEYIESLPEGLDTEVGERGVRLSGGQRQRIGIARALYRNPSFLVFDEATSALDNETEKEVMKAIDSLHGNKTMLMIAHRLSTIENCDHVYKVENGTVEKVR